MSETDKAVAKVIESAGKVAPELWADMVAAAQVEAWMAVAGLMFGAIAIASFARWLWGLANRDNDADYRIGSSILFVVSCVFVVMAGAWVDDALYPQASVVNSVMGR